MGAIEALAAAKAARIKLTLDGDGIIVEARPPGTLSKGVLALLAAAKPDLMKVLEWREAARAVALSESPPGDCGFIYPVIGVRRWTTYDEEGREILHTRCIYGPPISRWALAMQGLRHFVFDGWGDQACLLGWTKDELYRLPPAWAHIHLTGAALLIGDRRVIAVTEDNIVIRADTGSTLKFRRLGREHLT